MSSDVLPLLPLDAVLFPGTPLPLHIFEPRYKLMTRECREREEPFGVIWGRPDGLPKVGCSAEIVKLLREYEDGRSDILTMGQSRFQLLETFDDLPYLRGRVSYLDDDDEASDPVLTDRLREQFGKVFRLVHGRAPERTEAGKDSLLSFRLAATLPLELTFRQQLLETSPETERQRLLAGHLEVLLVELQRRDELKRRIKGNGFGR